MQDQSAPRLSKVNITESTYKRGQDHYQDIISPGIWSTLLYTGKGKSSIPNAYQYINFYVSNDEVRSKNTAVKIWKRIQ